MRASSPHLVPAAIGLLPAELRRRLAISQQCRAEDLETARKAYGELGLPVELSTFFDDVPERLARAHLVICRSGASTVAELAAAGRPAILLPFPHATDDHQTANAQSFAAAGGGWLMPEAEATPAKLAETLKGLIEDPATLVLAAHRAWKAGQPEGSRAPGRSGERARRREGGRMKALPLEIGLMHFVGIGGIGMSGIAEILHNLGYQVQGSDLADSYTVKHLRELGIRVAIGHGPENLGEASVVVVSSAIKPDNPELVAARARQLPIVRRAEMLGELMRLKWSVAVGGTHGKTTTTSLVAALLDAAGFDPTVINGGIINNYGTNARLGTGDWMVVEADESDGSFVKLPGHHRRRHQHGCGASRLLRHGGGDEPRLRAVRREHPLLRLRRALHRPSGGPGDDRPDQRPAHRHLWPQPAGRSAGQQHRHRSGRAPATRRSSRPAPARPSG